MRKIFILSLILIAFPFFAKAENYDFYVNKSFSGQEEGTLEKPFKSIGAAIKSAGLSRPGLRKIFISQGVYEEEIDLKDSIKLFGQNKEETILKINPTSTLTLNDNNILQNLTVSGGLVGVTIKGTAIIENCYVEYAKKKGIDLTIGNSLVQISNSRITNNGGKGVYVQKGRRIYFIKNIMDNNGGEGFDVRQNISGLISENYIYSNTESGIEILSSASDVTIKNNRITNNLANGIANQSYPDMPDLGKINIQENNISGNGKYGVYCGAPSGGSKTKTFFSESIALKNNSNSGNWGKPVSGSCHFERQTAEYIQNISSNIEEIVTQQAKQRDQFYEIETEIDSRLELAKKQSVQISNASLLSKIFFGISKDKLQYIQNTDQEILKYAENLSTLKAPQNEILNSSIENLVNSAKEEIIIHSAIIKKSNRLNIIFWIPIKITSLFS